MSQTFTAYLQSNLNSENGVIVGVGKKVWYKFGDPGTVQVVAYSEINVEGNTTHEVVVPLQPPVITSIDMLVPSSPPPSPPPSPTLILSGNPDRGIPLRL